MKLFDLPPELFNAILFYLEFPSLLCLRLSCKQSGHLITAKVLVDARRELAAMLFDKEMTRYYEIQEKYRQVVSFDLALEYPPTSELEIELYSSQSTTDQVPEVEMLACYVCLRELPVQQFVKTQASGRRSLGHREAGKRFCTECGFRRGIWEPGKVIKDFNGYLVVCRKCKQLKQVKGPGRSEGICTDCLNDGELGNAELPESHDRRLLVGTAVSMFKQDRTTRCQRCWAIDHTVQIPEVIEASQPLCSNCYNLLKSRPHDTDHPP